MDQALHLVQVQRGGPGNTPLLCVLDAQALALDAIDVLRPLTDERDILAGERHAPADVAAYAAGPEYADTQAHTGSVGCAYMTSKRVSSLTSPRFSSDHTVLITLSICCGVSSGVAWLLNLCSAWASVIGRFGSPGKWSTRLR